MLYGGAAGGGKSDAILMGALQFVDEPGYAAIIFRKTYTDLSLPGALMDRARSWLQGTEARWADKEKTWHFPSGATLTFGYLDTVNDKYRYQSAEFQYIGFDEATQFAEIDYGYLFSRLRRLEGSRIPLRMRAATNPGGSGHIWIKKRFEPHKTINNIRMVDATRAFVPAKLDDNPFIDKPKYRESLAKLDSQTRARLERGDWSDFAGNFYHPEMWPRYYDVGDAYRIKDGERWRHIRKVECSRLITLDWAMGKPKKDAPAVQEGQLTGDCTAFVVADLVDDTEGLLFLLYAINERIPLGSNAPRLEEVCRRWEPVVVSGDDDNLSETMLLECRRYRDIPMIKPMGIRSKNKLTRSQAAIVRGERGMIYLPHVTPHPEGYRSHKQDWVEMLCDQLASFTGVDGEADDIADAMSIMGRLADEFKPGEDQDDYESVMGSTGYTALDGE